MEAAACDRISATLKKMASKPFTRAKVGGSSANVKFVLSTRVESEPGKGSKLWINGARPLNQSRSELT